MPLPQRIRFLIGLLMLTALASASGGCQASGQPPPNTGQQLLTYRALFNTALIGLNLAKAQGWIDANEHAKIVPFISAGQVALNSMEEAVKTGSSLDFVTSLNAFNAALSSFTDVQGKSVADDGVPVPEPADPTGPTGLVPWPSDLSQKFLDLAPNRRCSYAYRNGHYRPTSYAAEGHRRLSLRSQT